MRMKFITFDDANDTRHAGWLRGDLAVDMHILSGGRLPNSMMEFLQNAQANLQIAQELDVGLAMSSSLIREGLYPLADIRLQAPLPRPSSIRDFYAFEAHTKTARRNRGLDVVPEWYEIPVFYFTNHQAVIGPEASMKRPSHTSCLDYELELACVIGREGRDISVTSADAYIFGYCIFNDWSARDLQMQETKVGLGPAKGKDFATSMGPYIVTPDELAPYQNGDRFNLDMTAKVNGRLLSQGNFNDIYYSFHQMIARASDAATLFPGDVIASGTVGSGCILELGTAVHRWLEPGDEVELAITGLGVLRNRVID